MTRNPLHLASVRVRGTGVEAGTQIQSRRRGVVLLAVDGNRVPTSVVRRAEAVTRGLGGRLHVVVALSTRETEQPAIVVSRFVDRIHALAPELSFDVELRFGTLREVAVEAAADQQATLVILDADAGGRVTSVIARRVAVPVLVARDPRPHGSIIAATKMADSRYPVLAASSELARAFERPLTYFHNSPPPPVVDYIDPMTGIAPLSSDALDEADASSKRERLQELTAGEVEVVVSRHPTTIDPLLELARERDADIVTIGQRRASWFDRLIGRRFTRRVVDRCGVLVVPMA